MTTTTLNMQLVLPVVGQTTGPDWATLINAALTKIDTHTHAQNNGVKVTPAGFNMSANMPCNDYSFTGLKSTTYQSQGSALATPASVHNVNGDLYWVSANGTAVQITNGTGLNLSSIGTIGGDYGQSGITASVAYSDSLKTFSFTQASGITAKMFLGDILLTPTSSGQNSITIKAPTGCSAWSFTMPSAAQTVGTTQAALTTNTSGVASHIGLTASNAPNTLVQRDASGNFSAGTVSATTFIGALTGNASGSSSSCTGNAATSSACTGNSATATLAATATNALACSGNSATATTCTGNAATATTATNQSGGTVNCTTASIGTLTATQEVLSGYGTGNKTVKTRVILAALFGGQGSGSNYGQIAHGITSGKTYIISIRGSALQPGGATRQELNNNGSTAGTGFIYWDDTYIYRYNASSAQWTDAYFIIEYL